MTNLKEFTALVFGFSMLAAAGSAEAQNGRFCGERDRILQRLAEGYGESRQALGLGANNSVLEVFASDDTGSWTITVTTPNGLTCLVATGQAFETVNEAVASAADKDT